MKKALTILLLICISCNLSLFAQGSLNKDLKFVPLKVSEKIVIDGVLNETSWENAPYSTGFKTFDPDYGKDMAEKTHVKYLYDDDNIYFAFKCFDSQPDKIKTSISSRDKIRADDWVCLNLDTFFDQQSLYVFYVNPLGIQMDSRASGDNEDYSADFVWFSSGKINNDGYTVEIQIPLKSIRFSQTDPVKMGMIFERKISRATQAGTFPPLDPDIGDNFYIQTIPIIYEDMKQSRLLEILPAMTYAKNSVHENGEFNSLDGESNFSVTAKYGITSDLIFDATYNPDFSQVEADAGQVDVNQRFPLFYPEKRPFFLEGRESFNFGGFSGGDALSAVVHTRQIENPIAGAKLTGKVSRSGTIASIFAVDELPGINPDYENPKFSILRYRHSLKDDNFIGGFITSKENSDLYNRVYGFDGQIRLGNASRIGFHYFASSDKDLAPDSQGEAIGMKTNGHALGVNYFYSNRDWMINLRLHDLSEDFDTKVGYVTRPGITRIRNGVVKWFYPKSKFFKRLGLNVNSQHMKDKQSDMWEYITSAYLNFVLPRSSSGRVGFAYSNEIFREKKLRTDMLKTMFRSQITKELFFSLTYNYGKKIRYTYLYDPYSGKGTTASAGINYQPNDNFNSTFSYVYSDFYRQEDDQKEFDYSIIRSRNTYQINKYVFLRGIIEYNSFYKTMKTDLLASFTYIPGTVVHLGYGSLYEKIKWVNDRYDTADDYLETRRGIFFKASYLWRMN